MATAAKSRWKLMNEENCFFLIFNFTSLSANKCSKLHNLMMSENKSVCNFLVYFLIKAQLRRFFAAAAAVDSR